MGRLIVGCIVRCKLVLYRNLRLLTACITPHLRIQPCTSASADNGCDAQSIQGSHTHENTLYDMIM